jgi:hypothetical protein
MRLVEHRIVDSGITIANGAQAHIAWPILASYVCTAALLHKWIIGGLPQ